MGISFSAVDQMERLGLLKPGCSVLDIGSSNLYTADVSQIEGFVGKYAPHLSGYRDFAERLAAGSAYDPVKGGTNGAFVGELFERAGMDYVSFDIADGYKTVILDLNRAQLPSRLRAGFDLVLNFGTTEHILNQFNCFQVMHDATRVGGHIFHSLPAIGYADHGYITYTGRFFFDIAGYNEYEIVDFWFEGPAGRNSIYDSVRSYRTYFPALERALSDSKQSVQGRLLSELEIPDVSINIIYRKVKEKSFWGALESSTSVGSIPGEVTGHYSGRAAGSVAGEQSERGPVIAGPGIVNSISTALREFPVLHRAARNIYRKVIGSR